MKFPNMDSPWGLNMDYSIFGYQDILSHQDKTQNFIQNPQRPGLLAELYIWCRPMKSAQCQIKKEKKLIEEEGQVLLK